MNYLESRSYILQKSQSHASPSSDDKEWLQANIKRLTKEDHIYIFNLIKNIDEKIYTVSQYHVVFDINNVPSTDFWIIYEYVMSSLECVERTHVIDNRRKENADILSKTLSP